MRAACAGLCLGLLLGCAARVAAQQDTPAVSVGVDDCVPVDHQQLQKLLAIELGTSTVRGSAGAAATHVRVSCAAQGIELRLEDAVTRKSMSRTLPASSFADASSTRLLALAIAEFVVASWIELSVKPRPSVEPVGPPADDAARRVAQNVVAEKVPRSDTERPTPTRTLSLGPGMQLWSAHDAVLFGAGLRLIAPLTAAFVWTLSGDVNAASADVAFGRIALLTASAALALALQLRADRFAFYFGPGARLGFTSLDAEAADPMQTESDDVTAAYGGPIWLSRVEARAGESVRIGLDVEAGLTTLPVTAETDEGVPVLELEGVWVSTVISAGLAF